MTLWGFLMQITRVTVRTFQNKEHAELFINFAQSSNEKLKEQDFKINMQIVQSISLPNQVISIWTYENENHMNSIRKVLSQFNPIPNSLMPKEIAYEGNVRILEI